MLNPRGTAVCISRLLLLAALLALAPPAAAREPLRFDLPCKIENGFYVVWLGTPAGPRRFIFDTGCVTTVICESLRDELALSSGESFSMGDFEGHRADVSGACLDSLRMGKLLFRELQTVVLPDSSFIFSCYGVDGIAGCDLLRNLVVRISGADSTITVADNIHALGPLDRKRSSKFYLSSGRPLIPVEVSAPGKASERSTALFDTGSAGWFSYYHCPGRGDMIDVQIAADVEHTAGYPSNMGWTNRVHRTQIVRGNVPLLTVAGVTMADIPFQTTRKARNVLGTAMLRWGQAVLDFRHRRFYFVPCGAAPLRAEKEPESRIKLAILNGRLIVGQVWDEGLQELVEPGDRIVRLGTIPVDTVDICSFLRGEIRPDKPEITVERKDGTRVMVSNKKR